MKSLQNQIVLITGAAGGFGQAMVRQLLGEGSLLVLADMRREALVRATEESLRALDTRPPGRVLGFVEADLSGQAGCDTLFQRVSAITRRVDILVNNAGIGMYGPFTAVPPAKWEQLMQVNLLSPMRLTGLFLPQMVERRSGHIVNISSVAGLVGAPNLTPYCTSKFGLRGFGEALSEELRAHHVDVTNIYPFYSRTPILDSEKFGGTEAMKVPDSMLYDPDFVIAELIAGIKARKLHIYPGAIPRRIDLLRRYAPWLVPLVNRQLVKQASTG
ncbi:MAG: SDR family oxidoreductase [Chloroflexaceae bacterium]|jgi:short-subunit dehydrogenase|nr:SDR family oxidoreductase [Chloroflexaceae bacterium]